MHALKLAGY